MIRKNLIKAVTLSLAVLLAAAPEASYVVAADIVGTESKSTDGAGGTLEAGPKSEPETTETEPETKETESETTETESETTATESETTETESETTETAESETPAESESESESETTKQTEPEELSDAVEIPEDESKKKDKVDVEAEVAGVKRDGDASSIVGFSVDPNSYPAANVSKNTKAIYKYLTKTLGLNHAAACGVLGNIQLESNFDPLALGDSGSSYGICQWHLERFNALISFCNGNGLDYNTLKGQLAYLKFELENGYSGVLAYIKSVPDTAQGAYDAAYYWCMNFEVPNDTVNRSIQRGNLAMNEFYPQSFKTAAKKKKKKSKKTTVTLQIPDGVSILKTKECYLIEE